MDATAIRRAARTALIDSLCAPVTGDDDEVVRRVLIADRHARAIAAELTRERTDHR